MVDDAGLRLAFLEHYSEWIGVEERERWFGVRTLPSPIAAFFGNVVSDSVRMFVGTDEVGSDLYPSPITTEAEVDTEPQTLDKCDCCSWVRKV